MSTLRETQRPPEGGASWQGKGMALRAWRIVLRSTLSRNNTPGGIVAGEERLEAVYQD